MIKQITENIIKFSFRKFGSHVYLMKKEKILIDTSSKANRTELLNDLEKLNIKPEDIKIILLTHGHWDHIENLSCFEKADIYISEKEMDWIVFPEKVKEKIIPLSKLGFPNIEVMKTPGHTSGSVCFFLPKEKILFSGDTLFRQDGSIIGRTDLKTSEPEKMQQSLEKLKKLKYRILCPGHG